MHGRWATVLDDTIRLLLDYLRMMAFSVEGPTPVLARPACIRYDDKINHQRPAAPSEPMLDEPCVRREPSGCPVVKPDRGLGPLQHQRYPTYAKECRMRYRMRTILAFTAAFACCFAWLNSRADQNRRQRQAIQQIWRMGGAVAFVGGSSFEQPSSKSRWAMVEFRAWLNDAILGRTARKLVIANYKEFRSSVDDDDIPGLVRAIRLMPELEEVRIRNTGITCEGVLWMRRELPNVRISLWSTEPTAASQRELSDIERLNRELLDMQEHYERLGYDETQIRHELEEFRSIWHELREIAQQQPTAETLTDSG